jgi:prepilin-type N-terminal cleavage/methylation domain-containing protein
MIPRTRRSAFTLVELLVVVTIIAILVALTAAAVFGVRRGMQKTNAESTLQKIDQKLLQKMKQMDDQITQDLKKGGTDNPEVVAILNDCGGNKDMAKAVMLFARTRRDMPMTVPEATTNFTVGGHLYRASPAFTGMTGGATIEDSAACLYAIIAPMGLDGLENQVGTTSDGRKCFTDGMGQPVGFVRLGYGGNANEITNKGQLDPFYPNKTGAGAYRNLANDYNAVTLPGRGTAPNDFQNRVWLSVRPNVTWVTVPSPYPGAQYHTAFCFSAGLNEEFLDPNIYDGDNLFSYRLRKEGARGD